MPEQSNRFCSQCGASIRADAKFCSACGTPVEKSEIAAEEPRIAAPPPPPIPQAPPPKKSGCLRRFVILACVLVGVVIFLDILGVAISKLGNTTAIAKSMRVQADIQAIKTQLQLYESMNGFYPTTEQGLQALVTQPDKDPRPARWYQLFKELPQDPWGNGYIYRCPGLKNPYGYDLFSAGPDRQPDTTDDDWGGAPSTASATPATSTSAPSTASATDVATPPATSGDDSWNNLKKDLEDRKRQANPEKPDQTPEPEAMPTQQTAATRVEAKPAANPDTDYKIGQEFKLGDYTYRITNFTLTSRVGNEFSREVAEEGAKFVVVYFTIRNDTNKTQQVLADDLEIKDGQGRQFSNDSKASTALMMSGGKKEFFLREIQPSLTGKGVTVFRVPTDVAKQPMILVVPEKGLFSSKKVTVLLTKEEQHDVSATDAEYLKAMTDILSKNKTLTERGPDVPAEQAQLLINYAKKREQEGRVEQSQYLEAAKIWLEEGFPPKPVAKLMPVFADTLIGANGAFTDFELAKLIGDAIMGKQSAAEKLRVGDLKKIRSKDDRVAQLIQVLGKRYEGANRKAKAEGEAPKP